jgi:hypothetical protein
VGLASMAPADGLPKRHCPLRKLPPRRSALTGRLVEPPVGGNCASARPEIDCATGKRCTGEVALDEMRLVHRCLTG